MADESGITYGPAQEKVTHTKVRFAKLPAGEGEYKGPNLIDLIKNTLPLLTGQPIPSGQGQITLDPTSPSFDLNTNTRHEAIHSLLGNADKSIIPAIIGPDVYGQIARQLMQSRNMENPVQEVPAYMGAYDPKQGGVPQDWRDEYIGKLQDSLAKINPGLAKNFALLSQTPNPQGVPQQ